MVTAPRFTQPLVLQLNENLVGRDFVVMDIHGTVSLLEDADTSGVPGVGRLFVGHNMHFDGLKQYGNVYALDTAAVQGKLKNMPGARLTMVNALMCTTVLFQPKSDGLIDVRDNPIKPKRAFSQ